MQLYHRYLKLPFNFEKPTLYDSIELKDYCEFIYFKDEDLKTEPILDFIDSIGLYRIKTNSVYSAPEIAWCTCGAGRHHESRCCPPGP